MRYFISFWVVLATFFIFSGQLQAADVVEQVEKQSISIPIEPIEPKASTKGNFWQKLRKNKATHTQVEPISSAWYSLIAVAGILIAIPSAFFVLFAFGGIWYWTLLGILGIIGLLALIFYIVKLFGAAQNKEGNFFKGQRFLLGYLSFIFICATWLLFLRGLSTIDFISGGGRRNLSFSEFATLLIISLIVALPFLIFNIIDHLRYRKYRKSQQKQSIN